MSKRNATPELSWWDRLWIQIYHVWVHLPYVRRNLLSVQAKREFKKYAKELKIKRGILERTGTGGWPWLLFFAPSVIILIAIGLAYLWLYCDLPVWHLPPWAGGIWSEAPASFYGAVLASLTAILIAMMVFSFQISRANISTKEPLLRRFGEKMGFVTVSSLLLGSVFADLILRCFYGLIPPFCREEAAVASLITPLLCTALLLITLRRSIQGAGKFAVLDLFCHAKKVQLHQLLPYLLQRANLLDQLAGIGIAHLSGGADIKSIGKQIGLYGEGWTREVHWPSAEKLARLLGAGETDSARSLNEPSRLSPESSKKALKTAEAAFLKALRIPNEGKCAWDEYGDYMVRLAHAYDASALSHLAGDFHAMVDDHFKTLEQIRVAYSRGIDYFLEGIPYEPPELPGLKYRRLIQTSLQTNDLEVAGVVISLISGLLWLAIEHRSPEYMEEVLGFGHLFYKMAQKAPQEAQRHASRLLDDLMVQAQRMIRSKVIRKAEFWFEDQKSSSALLVNYFRPVLWLDRRAAEAGDEERFSEWLNTINGFTWGHKGLTYGEARISYKLAAIDQGKRGDEVDPELAQQQQHELEHAKMKLEVKRIECMPDLVLCAWFTRLTCGKDARSPANMHTYLMRTAKYLGELPDLIELYLYYQFGGGSGAIHDMHCSDWHMPSDFPGPDFPGTPHSFGVWWDRWIPRFIKAHALKAMPKKPPGRFDGVETFATDSPQVFEWLKHDIRTFNPNDEVREWYLDGINVEEKKKRLLEYLDQLEEVTLEAQKKAPEIADAEPEK